MKMKMMCGLAMGCAMVMGASIASAQGQGSDQDKQFLMTASQSDYNEIHLSQLAAQKSQNAQVKAFAQKMITDHTKLDQEMLPFAQKMGVTPVSSLDAQHQQIYDQLNQLSGADV